MDLSFLVVLVVILLVVLLGSCLPFSIFKISLSFAKCFAWIVIGFQVKNRYLPTVSFDNIPFSIKTGIFVSRDFLDRSPTLNKSSVQMAVVGLSKNISKIRAIDVLLRNSESILFGFVIFSLSPSILFIFINYKR